MKKVHYAVMLWLPAFGWWASQFVTEDIGAAVHLTAEMRRRGYNVQLTATAYTGN